MISVLYEKFIVMEQTILLFMMCYYKRLYYQLYCSCSNSSL